MSSLTPRYSGRRDLIMKFVVGLNGKEFIQRDTLEGAMRDIHYLVDFKDSDPLRITLKRVNR